MDNYDKKNVLVGLSGGIDSAVSAAILKERGYDITGCYLCLTEDSSPDSEDARSAAQIADKLGIRFITADFKKEFKENVMDYFSAEYLAGRTPNPCVKCNPTVKFASLFHMADKLGIENVATGHYAKTVTVNERTYICASPSKKDQSYFLYRLNEEMIKRIIFPLGDFLSKEEIRQKGRNCGFDAAEKPDSLEVCFIPDNDYARFICEGYGYSPKKGNFTDADGKIIGTHSGIIHYTVGQRKGLGAFGEPRYVKYINAKDNTVTLCKKDERFGTSLIADSIAWNGPVPDCEFSASVKIRSTAKAEEAAVSIKNGVMSVNFSSPVLAPTPGQSAVVYKDGVVLGGGIIMQ